MNTPTNTMSVEQRQRRQATILGLSLGAGCFSLMVACIIIFSQKGLPKDPKEWKRLQEQRAAAAASADKDKASVTTEKVEPQQKDQTQ
jgi:anaerobic C4-dicarboxylate transporter